MKTLVRGGSVIAFQDGHQRLVTPGDVLVDGDRVAYAGPRFEGIADRTIDAAGRLVMPGLLNLHVHSLSAPVASRGILEDEGDATLYKYLLPLRYGTPDFRTPFVGEAARRLSAMSYLALLKSGTTTVLDMTDNLADAIDLARETGIRLYAAGSYYTTMPFQKDGQVVYPSPAADCPKFDENVALVRQFNGSENDRIRVWLGPHAPDTCSVGVLRRTRDMAEQLGVGISTHLAQSRSEVAEVHRRTGRTPAQLLADVGLLGPDCIVAHCHFCTEEDFQLLQDAGVSVAHCPWAYARRGGTGYLAELRRRGINTVLGSDQDPMDLISLMRLAAQASKIRLNDPFATTALDAFNAVTLNAARALGRDDLGRLASGCKADLVVVDFRRPHLAPAYDYLKMLVYHAHGGDVETVMVDGQIVVENSRVVTVDEAAWVARADETAQRLWREVAARYPLPRRMLE
jgi:cytosine/adenosine deaminase-related metal-dependent hydrolase